MVGASAALGAGLVGGISGNVLGERISKRGGKVGAIVGAGTGAALGYGAGNYGWRKGIDRSHKKFKKVATDDELKTATEQLKDLKAKDKQKKS